MVALLGVIGLINGATTFADSLNDLLKSRPDRDRELVNQELPRERTPAPGVVGPVLGYGDANGGRTAIPYTAEDTYPPDTPVLNSFVDLETLPPPFNDERKFVAVKAVRGTHNSREFRWTRIATVPAGRNALVRVYINNNARNVPDCQAPDGLSVAVNTRLRVGVWRNGGGKRHIIRAWVSANNAFPRWVTDAVLVRTHDKARLVLDIRHSQIWRDAPATATKRLSAKVLSPAGMAIGTDGALGSCWENRNWVALVFRPARTS